MHCLIFNSYFQPNKICSYLFQIYSPNEKKPFVSIAGEWSGLMEAKWHDTNVMYTNIYSNPSNMSVLWIIFFCVSKIYINYVLEIHIHIYFIQIYHITKINICIRHSYPTLPCLWDNRTFICIPSPFDCFISKRKLCFGTV